MSAINSEVLKSPSDPTIPFFTNKEDFATAQLRHDALLEFSRFIKSLKIVNNDTVNAVTFRTQSPSAPLQTVDPGSETSLDEWSSYIEINPDGATGDGQLELDLVEPKDAIDQRKQDKLEKIGAIGGL